MVVHLKHVAIASADPDKSAKFFVDVLGWSIAGRIDSKNALGYYVTDGVMNIALLNFKNRPAAGLEFQQDYTGLHHLGFQCDDIEALAERFEVSGYAPRHDVNTAQGLGKNPAKENAEFKMTGPENVMIDISERGWVGTSTFKGISPK
jgi:glyoxylase I family protein